MTHTHSFDSSAPVPSIAAPATPIGSDTWLRALVADRLGVADAALVPSVSLRDDLAADSLDFAVLASALEDDIGIEVPVSLLDRVHTYGDLFEVAASLLRERARRAREGVALLRTRTWNTREAGGPVTERVFWLDPYAIEILLDDASHAPAGTYLEVVIDPSTPAEVVARVRGRLGRLERRGVVVDVRRGRRAA